MVYLQKFCNYNDHQDHHHMIRNVDQGFQSMMIMKEDLRLIKRVKSKLFSLLCLCFLSCSFIWVSQIFGFPFSVSYILRKYKFIIWVISKYVIKYTYYFVFGFSLHIFYDHICR